MIVPAYPIPEMSQVQFIAHLASLKYISGIPRPTSFEAIQAHISGPNGTFSRKAIAINWALVYNETAIDYKQITGDDLELLCIIRGALEEEGLLNIMCRMESWGVPMPNESTGLQCSLLPTSQKHTFSLLVQHLGLCCQGMGKGGHAVTIVNQSNPKNNPTSSGYALERMPCGGQDIVNNFASCNISFPSDPSGETLTLTFAFVSESGKSYTTSRTLIA